MLYLYQIFILLRGHLHFFLHFSYTFMENLFKKHPISTCIIFWLTGPFTRLFKSVWEREQIAERVCGLWSGIPLKLNVPVKLSPKYRVITFFRIILAGCLERKEFYKGKQRQSTLSGHIFKIFGHCQNHQNWTLK